MRSVLLAALVLIVLGAGPGAVTPASAQVSRLAGAGGVRAAVPLPDMGPDGEWWFTAWQIPRVWAAGARGQGVTVAVVDSGVQASWPELRGVVLPGTDYHGGDGRTDHSRQVDGDDRGHGTAMALNIAGQGGSSGLVGVAPEARILPIVRQRAEGDVGRNIRWAVDHGAKVINMSYYQDGQCSQDDQEAVRYAVDHGAVVVTGSGNEGMHTPRGIGRPTSCLGVLNVAALDNQLRAWNRSSTGPFVSLAAPGVHMQTLMLTRQPAHADGTSDSSSLTSGVVALVWSRFPQLTNRQVVARILATARDLGAPGKDDVYGYGAVRPYQAITAEVPADAPNPVFDQLTAGSTTSPTSSSGSPAADPLPRSPGPASRSGSGAGSSNGVDGTASGGGGLPALLLTVAGLVLVGVALIAVLRLRRRRTSVSGRPSA